MDPSNTCAIFEQASRYDMDSLLKKALAYIETHAATALSSASFKNLSANTLCQIIRSDSLDVRELSVFEAVLAWAEAECQRQNVRSTTHNKRKVLGDIFYQVRIPTMKLEEFANTVVKSGMLSDQEQLQVFKYFTQAEKATECSSLRFPLKPRSGYSVNSIILKVEEQHGACLTEPDNACTLEIHTQVPVVLCGIELLHPRSDAGSRLYLEVHASMDQRGWRMQPMNNQSGWGMHPKIKQNGWGMHPMNNQSGWGCVSSQMYQNPNSCNKTITKSWTLPTAEDEMLIARMEQHLQVGQTLQLQVTCTIERDLEDMYYERECDDLIDAGTTYSVNVDGASITCTQLEYSNAIIKALLFRKP